MVAEASGCCASAVSAFDTERPSPSAGIMQPMLVVKPAVMIEVIAMRVVGSMGIIVGYWVAGIGFGSRVRTAAAI